ncbi:MAG: hypothetical protein V3U29_08875, partial [Phycisphaeraceae bacterium]
RSLTIEDLRDKPIDADPPDYRGEIPGDYPDEMTDGYDRRAHAGAAYVADGIGPFRFKYFDIAINYRAKHNWNLDDYAVLHGFNIVEARNKLALSSTGIRTNLQFHRHYPGGTIFTLAAGTRKVAKQLTEHHKPPYGTFTQPRWDLVHRDENLDTVDEVYHRIRHLRIFNFIHGALPDGIGPEQFIIKLDLEHPVLKLNKLKAQKWYSRGLEADYYAGFAHAHLASAKAAKQPDGRFEQPWLTTAIYSIQQEPFRWRSRGYLVGLDLNGPNLNGKPVTEGSPIWEWEQFRKLIFEHGYDIKVVKGWANDWDQRHVPLVLALTDLNMMLAMASAKPTKVIMSMSAQFTTQGNHQDWRWWRGLPMPVEDARAMTAMALFGGVDGLLFRPGRGLTSNLHVVPEIAMRQEGTGTGKRQLRPDDPEPDKTARKGPEFVVKTGFTLAPIAPGAPPRVSYNGSPALGDHRFKRYDVIHVLGVGPEPPNKVRFQLVRKTTDAPLTLERKNSPADRGLDLAGETVGYAHPVFEMARADLQAKLMPRSAGMSGVIEGLALAKQFEFCLRVGRNRIGAATSDARSALKVYEDAWGGNSGRGAAGGPVMRWVKIGPYHVIATFDPDWLNASADEQIEILDFDGTGQKLTLPADKQVRLFVLKDPDPVEE